ncbi:MAG: hypothetical protein FJ090_20675 [Deltaproteobacteria bacterium]|nr:hypothetical protein [Deltaproteobacteria bacterium]
MILTVYKRGGDSPLQALDRLRLARPELAAERMVYAGRLDPMAEGLLLVLTGEDRYALPAHLGHDKEYVARFLFGLASDTHDALGRLALGGTADVDACAAWVAGMAGTHELPLPAWSAHKVRGKPLHAWAAAGLLAQIEVPMRRMVVRQARVLGRGHVASADVAADVAERISRVRGAFRQDAVLADWALVGRTGLSLAWVDAELTVDAGVYARSLAHQAGAVLGFGALLSSLRRTRIGPYRG